MRKKTKFDKPPIILMGTTDTEVQMIALKLTNPKGYVYGDCTFTEGYLDGYPAVVVLNLVGVANAAFATTIAIETYNPKCVIFNGTSGAHNPNLHQGDIILGRDIISHTITSPRRKEGEGVGDPEEMKLFGIETLVEGKTKSRETLHSSEELLETAMKVPYEKGALRCGTILTGDFWNREVDKIKFYHRTYGTDCEEMEGFSVAHVCKKLDTPVLIVRIISNSEYYPEEEFDPQLGVQCQEYTFEVMKEIIKGAR